MEFNNFSYQKVRGSNQSGEVPSNYRCYKCYKPGHWIKNCPLVTAVIFIFHCSKLYFTYNNFVVARNQLK